MPWWTGPSATTSATTTCLIRCLAIDKRYASPRIANRPRLISPRGPRRDDRTMRHEPASW
jgi:hypothetical protein